MLEVGKIAGGLFSRVAVRTSDGNLDLPDACYRKLKVLRGGLIMVVEAESNDAVFLDANLKECRRIKGSPSPAADLASLKRMARLSQSEFTTEAERVLWMNGPHSLALVSVLTFAVDELPGFWQSPVDGLDATGVVATTSHKLTKAGGIGLLAEEQTLHIWDASKQPATKAAVKMHGLLKSRHW